MKVLEGLLYTKTHEWVKVLEDYALIGITEKAAEDLGEIVFFEGREKGEQIDAGLECGALESIKAAEDLIAPISGEVIECNQEAVDNPEAITKDPFNTWLLKVRITNEKELSQLLSKDKYQEELGV